MQSQSNTASASTVKIMSLEDVKYIDASNNKPLNILVTTHGIKPLIYYNDAKIHGLGLWINYIINEYLVKRNIAFNLFTKSLSDEATTSTDDFINFVTTNEIDIVIPSDVTDTMYLARNHELLSKHVNFSVTDDVKVYELLENKWETFNLMQRLGIFTPDTEIVDQTHPTQQVHQYPFFLKIASGTNAGRGVWLCKNENDLQEALETPEMKNNDDVLLIKQKPVSGDIICGQAIYDHGKPRGYFFTKSVQSDNLAGMSENYIRSQSAAVKDIVSHVKVELTDSQWDTIHNTFTAIGNETKYNGMIDIEFIVSPTEGLCLLECNPRFSGALHTTLSNVGFLDLYFDALMNYDADDVRKVKTDMCGNYSAGVEMQARVGNFSPAAYYAKDPLRVLSLRQWNLTNPIPYSNDQWGIPIPYGNDSATEEEKYQKERVSLIIDKVSGRISDNATWLKNQLPTISMKSPEEHLVQ